MRPSAAHEPSKQAKAALKQRSAVPTSTSDALDTPNMSLRELCEAVAAENDLVFLPVGRSEPRTGLPVYRVSRTVDGKDGIAVYLQDVPWAQTGVEWEPIGIEEMIRRARG